MRLDELQVAADWNLMPIDIVLETERGEIIERCPHWFTPWDYMNHPEEVQNTCFLQFIDEYGDTTFNQSQLPLLIQELEAVLPKSKDSSARQRLESLIDFIRKAEGKIHTYIKFVGD
jgi:hypothetical protein